MFTIIKKYFTTDQDNPPFLQKAITFFIFSFLLIGQYLNNAVHMVLPKKLFLKKISKALQINSLEILEQHPPEDDLPPLPFTRLTMEEDLAGFQHEQDPDYKCVLNSFNSVYNLGAYSRFKQCFHREIGSCPTHVVKVRMQNGEFDNVINTCSYNYLGYAGVDFDTEKLLACVDRYGLGCFLNRSETDLAIFRELEEEMRHYLNVEDVIVHTMGYDTNAMSIPFLVTPKSLIVSDQFNHNSIVRGCTVAGARIARFRHDDLTTLDKVMSDVKPGQYDKVIVLVEGLYSMEGSFVNLPAVVALKKKYGFLLFVDEAHSIGALGPHGGGIRDYYNEYDVDFCMGTFTKSFSSVGGYVGGKAELIKQLRQNSPFFVNRVGMSPLFAQQSINAIRELNSEKGQLRITRLKENTLFFRTEMKRLGFVVYGPDDSPVVPIMFYDPTLMGALSTALLKKKIASVVVGFPAVPLTAARIRFCLSASHTREDLEYVVRVMDELGDAMKIKHALK